jgi:hypothetical protein
VKTGYSPAEFSKEGSDSKKAVLPVMMNVEVIGRGLF